VFELFYWTGFESPTSSYLSAVNRFKASIARNKPAIGIKV